MKKEKSERAFKSKRNKKNVCSAGGISFLYSQNCLFVCLCMCVPYNVFTTTLTAEWVTASIVFLCFPE